MVAITGIEDVVGHLTHTLGSTLSEQFLDACFRDTFNINLNSDADVQNTVEQPNIVFRARIEAKRQDGNVRNFIDGNSLHPDREILRRAASAVQDDLLTGAHEVSFSSAFLDSLRGSRIKVFDYHEPENSPSLVKRLVQDYKAPAINAVVWGSAPAAATTVLAAVPWIGQNLALNILHQSAFWGGCGGLATMVAGYYSFKSQKDPRREYHYLRKMGKEISIRDEASFYPEDDSLKIPREPYTGIKQTYILTPFNRHENIDLAAWSGTNPGKPLFQVALSNNISRYVIWILFLEGKVKNYTMAYSVVKSFECEVLKVESTDINPRLAAGYFTHFYRMALLHETPKFHLTHR